MDVSTLRVGVTPTIIGEALVDILITVSTRPPRLTIASVATGKIDAGAILAWIRKAFIDWIGCWCDSDPSIAIAVTVVASVTDAAVVARVHVFLTESVARISAEFVLHPIISLPVVGVATISELGPSFTGDPSPLHPGSDFVRTVKWRKIKGKR